MVPAVIAQETDPDTWNGPYLDKIRYVYINGSNPLDPWDEFSAQIQPLIDGDIDVMTTQTKEPHEIESLQTAEYVEVVEFWRSATYDAKINCYRWPLNISGVRKALHLAMDKKAMCAIQGGRYHDSPIISPLTLSIESEMTHHYYEAEVSEGAAILDSLGFIDIDSDGWREGPDGVEIPAINVEFLRGEEGGPLNEDNANLIVEAFHNLNLNAYSTRIYDYTQAHDILDSWDFDIFLFALIGHDLTMDSWINWMLSRPDWSNATFEALAEIALHSVDYHQVVEAFKEMQCIWVEEAPHIILVQLALYSAYRTNGIDGIVEHPSYGPHSYFTGLNASSDSNGGELRFGTTNAISDSHEEIRLTPTTCAIEEATWFAVKSHMEMMHDSLAIIDPDLNVINWLAESYSIETHDDDPTIPDGNTRIVVDLVQNAYFSDGTRLTADDVVYSILWFNENFDHLDTYGSDSLPFDISSCFASGLFQVELQFTTESFWHWYKICFTPIIPKHVRNQYDPQSGFRLTPDEFNENLVVSGPFMASEWVLGEYIDIVPNPYYWRKPPIDATTTTTTTTTEPPPEDPFLPIIAGIAGAATVIVIGGFAILRKE